MSVKDSNRTRQLVIMLLVARGGHHTSGHHDNFFAWVFYKLDVLKYAHERVTALKHIILAMERDGLLTLGRSDNGKVMSGTLTTDAVIEDIDDEDLRIFETRKSLWLLVIHMKVHNKRLKGKLCEFEEAFNELMAESELMALNSSLEARIRELENASTVQERTHAEEVKALEHNHQRRIAALRVELRQAQADYAESQRRLDEQDEAIAALRSLPATVIEHIRNGGSIAIL